MPDYAGLGNLYRLIVPVALATAQAAFSAGTQRVPAGLSATDWGAIQAEYLKASNTGGSQQAHLKASNAGMEDLFGHSAAISGDTVVSAPLEDSNATGVNGNGSDNSVTDSGAAYVFVRSGNVWTQQAYLKASNTGMFDHFGWSVAMSGDTVAVGARGEDSAAAGINGNQSDNSAPGSGAVCVFVRSGGTWSQEAYVKASNPEHDDSFGWSVAVSGDTVVVGAFDDSNASTVNGDQSDNSADASGAAYVFVRGGGTWTQQAYLKAFNARVGAMFGSSVGVSGDTAVVGSLFESSDATGVNGEGSNTNAIASGAAYVFVRKDTVWTQQAYLKPSNTGATDQFGTSVAISGDTIVVGAPREDGNSTGVNGNGNDNSLPDSGVAYVFVRNGDSWSQTAYLKASNTGGQDQFGRAVTVSGDAIAVGAPREDGGATGLNGDGSNNNAEDSGAAYLFTNASQAAYQFEGFFAPVQGGAVLNNAKAGQVVALKWRVLDGLGQAVTTLANVSVTARPVSCSEGTVVGPEIEADAAGASGLQNLGNGYYQFNWKTSKSLANSCATLHLSLGDGLNHTALFLFR